ncbi:MAG: hypothetical protein IJ091_10310 [Oscillospiraceae bacterium]|nr:hypothetical protein [Oscillospiraceae bacterium]
MEERTTEKLNELLKKTRPEDLEAYLDQNKEQLRKEELPFPVFIREKFREKGIKQQEVFLASDIPEGYGYKLISGEKHTKQRDVLIRLCLGAHFTLRETQQALRLYGMSPLYSRIPRDCVFIISFNRKVYDVQEVDQLLQENQFEPLYVCHGSI